MDVNEWMSYECSEYVFPHLNIHNSSTRSHPSEEENRLYACGCSMVLAPQYPGFDSCITIYGFRVWMA